MRLSMLRKTNTEPRVFSYAIGFHDFVVSTAEFIYANIFPLKNKTVPELAHSNMDKLVQELLLRQKYIDPPVKSTAKNKKNRHSVGSLEKCLSTFGDCYIPRTDFESGEESVLWDAALQYDLKGIVSIPKEELKDFVYRGNSLLFLHRQIRRKGCKVVVKPEEGEIKLRFDFWGLPVRLVNQADLEEACKRIPYFMDLSWVTAYVTDKKKLLVSTLGLTFTLPEYNGFNFIEMLPEYKSREQFISVLSHELTHAGTVYFDSRRSFIETKAYSVGKGDLLLGEYVVSFNATPPLWMTCVKLLFEHVLHIPISDKKFSIVPKALSFLEVLDNTGSYRAVEKELNSIYGVKGGYILGRLNADELEEFRDTDHIPARIDAKNDLKWRIMKDNFERL